MDVPIHEHKQRIGKITVGNTKTQFTNNNEHQNSIHLNATCLVVYRCISDGVINLSVFF